MPEAETKYTCGNSENLRAALGKLGKLGETWGNLEELKKNPVVLKNLNSA